MELVELLPTQGSIRIGPVQVQSGGPDGQLAHRADISFAQPVRLESFDLQIGLSDRRSQPEAMTVDGDPPVARMPAGETLQLDLLWRSLIDHPGVYIVAAELIDEHGFRWAFLDGEPDDRMYPSWMWSANEQIHDQLRMPIPSETPPGRYTLTVKLFDRGQLVPILDASGRPAGGPVRLIDVNLDRASAQPRERDVAIADRKRQKVTDDLELIGTELHQTDLAAGDTLDLAVAWHATRDVSKNYEARLRVLGSGDRVWGEAILPPAGSGNPTGDWERNDIFKAQYAVPLNRDAGPGDARLVLELREVGSDRVAGRVDLGQISVR